MKDAAKRPMILWASLDVAPGTPEHGAFVDAMAKFPGVVEMIVGGRTELVQVMPKKLAKWCVAEAARAADLPEFCCGWMKACHDELAYLPNAILLCSPSHALALRAREANQLARWGANCGSVSLYYGPPGKDSVWHEALHLLGAEDCYDEKGNGPTCGLSNCIMQWVPTRSDADSWPFLCDKNCHAVRQLVEAFCRNTKGGKTRIENANLMCRSCNSRKGGR